MSINKATLIGRLGNDPEIKYFQDGTAYANMSVATSEKWKDRNTGEMKEHTEWHRITVRGKNAENCGQYLHKGSLVYIEGKLKTRQWEKDGQTHYTTEVLAIWVEFLGGGKDQGGGQRNDRQAPRTGQGEYQSPGGSWDNSDDEIPF
jgi:single-strand DNA-binding protein